MNDKLTDAELDAFICRCTVVPCPAVRAITELLAVREQNATIRDRQKSLDDENYKLNDKLQDLLDWLGNYHPSILDDYRKNSEGDA